MRALIGGVLYGFDKEVGEWVTARVDGMYLSDDFKALGIVRGESLAAGVVYEFYNGVNVTCSIAVDDRRWVTKEVMRRIFAYPFQQLGCRTITVMVAETNLKSLNLVTKMGFEVEALVKFAAPDGSSLIVLKMYRENCRWIRHGQERRGAAEDPRSV